MSGRNVRLTLAAVLGTASLVTALVGRGAAQGGQVPFPDGYRSWLHVKSMVIHEPQHPLYQAFGGIHHVYVNPTGAQALRTGGPFPDGSVLVFDLLETRAEGGALVEGPRKFVAVMRKDRRAHPDTGGWGFEAFKGDSRQERVVQDARTQCFACHQSQAARDYVFASLRP